MLRILPLLVLFSVGGWGLKFPSRNAISLDQGDSLRVNEFGTLSCNYIKWKQENINKIEWYLGYSGVNTKLFTYHFDNQHKELANLPSAYFSVYESGSGENEVRLKLLDDRSETVNICCKVEAIRDSGYGSIRKVDKEKCVPMPVITGPPPEPVVRLSIPRTTVQAEALVDFICQVEYIKPVTIKVFANRDPVAEKRDTDRFMSNFTASDELFRQGVPDTFSLRCVIYDDGTEIGRSESLTITKDRSFVSRFDDQEQQDMYNKQPRKGKNYADPQAHRSHGDVPCHSYIVVTDFSSSYNKKTEIVGELVNEVRSAFPTIQQRGDTYTLTEDPVQVLNVLGYNGHRVVAMAFDQREGRMSWTLERAYFEFHRNEL